MPAHNFNGNNSFASPREKNISFKRCLTAEKGIQAQTDDIDWVVDTIAYLIEILSKLKDEGLPMKPSSLRSKSTISVSQTTSKTRLN